MLRLMLAALVAVCALVAIPAASAGRSTFIEYGYGDPPPTCSWGVPVGGHCDVFLF